MLVQHSNIKIYIKIHGIYPGGTKANQIDHVLVNRRRKSSILDVRTCRSANCDSDHYLVRIRVNQKISKSVAVKGERRTKWDVKKLKTDRIAEEYRTRITEDLAEVNESGDEGESMEEVWRNIESSITNAAEQIVGKMQYKIGLTKNASTL